MTKQIKRLELLKTQMIKGFSLFLKNLGFILFFVANSVNIHKKSLLGSVVIIKYCFLFLFTFFFVLKKKVNGR